jgi:hypothetical protein
MSSVCGGGGTGAVGGAGGGAGAGSGACGGRVADASRRVLATRSTFS